MTILIAADVAVPLSWAMRCPFGIVSSITSPIVRHMTRHIGLALATLCATLSGCAIYQAQPVDPKAEAAAFESQSIGARPWTLTDLQAEAVRRHPEAAIAQARLNTAEAGVVSAGAKPNPTLSTSAQKNTSAEPGTQAWAYGLGLDFPLETASKRDHRAALATWQLQAAAYAQAETLWHIRGRVREAYIGAYPMDGLASKRYAVQEELLKQTQRRLAAGMASSGETLQASVATKQAARLVEASRQRQRDSLRKLAAAVGVPERALDEATLAFADLTAEALPGMPLIDEKAKLALQARPDVLAALAEYEASQAKLQLEIACQYPDVSLGPGYTWDAGALKWSLGLSFALPLFDHNQGEIAQAQAKRQEAAAAFRSVQAQAIAEIGDARAAYAQAIKMLEMARGAAADQLAQLRMTERAFDAGAADRSTVLSARLEAAMSDSAGVEALLEGHLAAGRLESALRQPLSPFSSAFESKGQP